MILNNVDSVRSLRSLVHASPSFHQSYLADRERVLTRATFCELEYCSIDILRLVAVCEVRLRNNQPPSQELKVAMQSIYDFFNGDEDASPSGSSPKRRLVLNVAHCLALLTIEELVAFEFKIDPSRGQMFFEGDPVLVRPSGVSPMKGGFKLSCADVYISEHGRVRQWNDQVIPDCFLRGAERLSVIEQGILRVIG